MGRDTRFGRLSCGGCSEKDRDEFRCVLKGHERPAAAVPSYRVNMGPTKRAALFTQCPVGLSLEDDRIGLWLTAYGLAKRWQKFPPGRDDPRLFEAFGVIAREHDLIDAEQLDALGK